MFGQTRLGGLVVALLALGLLTASPAAAAYEQVDTFAGTPGVLQLQSGTPPELSARWPEEVQLGGVGGMAVNRTGAGGVPPGTLYAATGYEGVRGVARFNPDGGFREFWSFTGDPPTKRCGADGDPAQSVCQSRPSAGSAGADVEVDQSTGYVYVMETEAESVGISKIHVYSPDGSKLIDEFGVRAAGGETTAASPEKVHAQASGDIAVDDSGTVYVPDFNSQDKASHRVMVFEPQSPGDYEHYVYAGQNHDIAPGFGGAEETINAVSVVTDASGSLYALVNDNKTIAKLDPSEPADPVICEFSFAGGQVKSMTVNPESGEVFFYSVADKRIHQLEPCDAEGNFSEAGKFAFSPKRAEISAMAFDPVRQLPNRSPGVLYAGAPSGEGGLSEGAPPDTKFESAMGYVFALPEEFPPEVIAESVAEVTETSAELGAQINPKGPPTNYVFQYINDAAYEANEPNERQSLTISATGGVFGLDFKEKPLGGLATATLASGSKAATALRTASATATLKAAIGTGDLNGAKGKGTLIENSTTISSVNPGEGSFEVGQGISGEGIPFRTKIVAVKAEEAPLSTLEVTISNQATKSAAHVALSAGTATLTSVNPGEGSFEVGQTISGEGIPAGTEITQVKAGELVLSDTVAGPKAAVALNAGSPTLTSLSPGFADFEVGQAIAGEGIAPGTIVLTAGGSTLTLSQPVTKPGTGVTVFSPGPRPLAAGLPVEGAGIPPGTTIEAIKAGEITLSNPATASGAEVLIQAGVPVDASAAQLRAALEALPTIGAGNVAVSGGPGDESGSSPYAITFRGDFENVDVPELTTDASLLEGGASTATVQTEHQGGGGFSSGAAEAPPGGAFLGEGPNTLSAAASLSGLEPDTTYHYRALATSHCSEEFPEKVCEGVGAPQAFRTFAIEAPELPDNRAWELISPVDKQGGEVLPADPTITSCPGEPCEGKLGNTYTHFPMQSRPDGEAVVYEGTPFSGVEGIATVNEYIARRDPKTGWQTTTLTPASSGAHTAFDTALDTGLLSSGSSALNPEAPSGYQNLYTQPTANPSVFSPALTVEPPNWPGSGSGFQLEYAGASADLSRSFFRANDALTEETPFAPEAQFGGDKAFNLYEWAGGQFHLVNVMPGNAETKPGASFGDVSANTISADGSRAFFSDESGLYVREDAEVTKAIPGPGKFLSASSDGARVLLDDGQLYDLETEAATDLTQGKGGFQGLVGQSDDLSHVYFVDTAVLDGAPNAQGDLAEAGKFNLYAWHEGVSRYVATLVAGDNTSGGEFGADWSPLPRARTAQASPAGGFLAFVSTVPLSGYANTGPCDSDHAGGYLDAPCSEVFLYDSATDTLSCPSCNPSNELPLGPSVLRRTAGMQPQHPYLTDSGRLYFDSRDALVPADTNERFEDVYQYEPNGVGTCKRQAGCTQLVSSGHESVDSNLVTIDETGKSVFFTTRDQLTLKDRDDLVDLYVAREDGGIPGETEVARGECQGEACVPLFTPPTDPNLASTSFEGGGNVDEKKKAKKHKKKHKHAKKHTHKRAAKQGHP